MAKSTQAATMQDLIGEKPAEPETPDFITATFEGQYYKSNGKDSTAVGYSIDVKVPTEWLLIDFSPVGLFLSIYANKPQVLGKLEGYSGVRTCHLVKTSELPPMPDEFYLNWESDYTTMARYSQTRRLGVRAELYPSIDELRAAIKRSIEEPIAFKQEQEARSKDSRVKKMRMESQLVALGY